MIQIRQAEQRGVANLGWLNSHHTFSFGQYYDPKFMGHGPLRVINDDRVQPSNGFGTHGHENMEIISYVIDGTLEHKDSMGNGSTIKPGDVQRMSAGTGVRHSEQNPSDSAPVHFLQIWIVPEAQGLTPSYEQINFSAKDKSDRWRLVGSHDGRDGSVTIHQDVDLYATLLSEGKSLTHELGADRLGWIQVVQGSLSLNDQQLNSGDGAALEGSLSLSVVARSDCEVLLFDMTAR